MRRFSSRILRAERERSLHRLRLLLGLLVGISLLAIGRPVEQREGVSGRAYEVFRMSERWTPSGSAVVLRYRSSARSRSAAAQEAADLLPTAAARARAVGVRRVVVQANAPVVRVGRGPAVYREWRFRFAEQDGAWLPERTGPTFR